MDVDGDQIYLSPPSVSDADVSAIESAMRSGWVSSVGPELAAFESEMANYLGVGHAVALSSGTAGLHLALKSRGIGPGDLVLVPTVTFAATAFAVTYVGAEPVFVDVDESGNMDPEISAHAIEDLKASGHRVKASIPVDLYGTPVNFSLLSEIFERFGVSVIEDAAEGLGATYAQQKVGSLGEVAVLSFNGNKIITASAGGMLVTNDADVAHKVRYWATQSREPYPWYEHQEIGYNYRLSNILAALGRSQLSRIDEIVKARRMIRRQYRMNLETLEGLKIQDDPPWGESNAWLSIVRFSRDRFPNGAARVREFLGMHKVESRPVWKPMHMQPVFSGRRRFLNGAAERFYHEGLCLPSGTNLSERDVDRISALILEALE